MKVCLVEFKRRVEEEENEEETSSWKVSQTL